MAPTKAIATYAVTRLILLTKGPSKVIAKSPSLCHCPLNAEASKAFPTQKVSHAALLSLVHSMLAAATWLKKCENNALKKP